METISFFLLNTFISDGLEGNPTPVCLLENPIEVEKMELLARKFKFPVSVFVNKDNTSNTFQIRYFTVTGEIPACGHGTLGAAHILFREITNSNTINFRTIEDTILTASKEKGINYIHYPKLEKSEIKPHSEINEAMGISEFKSYFICKELESLFIELEKEKEVRKLLPDYNRLLQSTNEIKEIVIMSKSDNKLFDFTLRSFCPWIGINEDPVTGSIHSVLGHFWKKRLNKDILIVNQASKRGGKLIVKPLNEFVKIGGDCKILEEGKI